MRKALKIKTLFMLLSWMVIFLHGVIPHNHHHSQKPNCHSIVHSDVISHNHHQDCTHGDEESPLYHTVPAADSEKICHFNTRLFQNIQIDQLYIAESGWHSNGSTLLKTEVNTVVRDLEKPPAFRSCMLLRAPPNTAWLI